jgi:EF-P beta-lysylation protein EpmB
MPIISPSTQPRQVAHWQTELAQAITDPAELCKRLQLDPALLPEARRAAALFPLRVPRGFVTRMRIGDPYDPLLLQVLPLHNELTATPGFTTDPVGERQAVEAPGLLHKYAGRALLITTGACAVHCRYCFRREFPYADFKGGDWSNALAYLADNTSINEVILSGGDPLTLSNRRLHALITALSSITHVEHLRIHTRQPIVLPERIEPELIALLTSTRFKPVIVLHANHPRELDATVSTALQQLNTAGMVLFNQTVLLKGINDSADILIKLSQTLFRNRVIPYYLHVLDKVRGTAHFLVHEQTALEFIKAMRHQLPGYLVPRLVREEAGKLAKVPVV